MTYFFKSKMTSLNKFYPAGKKTVTRAFMKHTCSSNLLCCKKEKEEHKEELQFDMDNPAIVEELWKKMGSPSATIFMCGYKISNGKIDE